jgi:hypothetical protein
MLSRPNHLGAPNHAGHTLLPGSDRSAVTLRRRVTATRTCPRPGQAKADNAMLPDRGSILTWMVNTACGGGLHPDRTST